MTIFTIDVSHHDRRRRGRPLDWAAIHRSGIPVMCARATYGDPAGFSPTTYYFDEFQTGARAAGVVLRGGYHNLIRGDSASIARQVGWFLRELDRHDCDWAMLDIERYAELVANGLWPRWSDVLRFRDAWARLAPGRVLTYYLPRWLWAGHLGSPDLRELGGPLVASDYGDNLQLLAADLYAHRGGDTGRGWQPYGHVTPALWQFGSRCKVPGATSTTDINAYRGTLTQLTALLTGRAPEIGDDGTMSQLVRQTGQPAVYLSNGLTRRWITDPAALAEVRKHARAYGLIDTTVREVSDITQHGVDIATLVARPVDPAALVQAMLAELGGEVEVNVTAEQLTPALDAALRKVLGGLDGATPPTGEQV